MKSSRGLESKLQKASKFYYYCNSILKEYNYETYCKRKIPQIRQN